MYLEHFGLEEMPFSIAPNPRYLYLTHQHQEALAHLTYGLGSAGGVILLTGEVGTGKTTISRKLLEEIPEHIDVAWIVNPKLSAEELLASVCDELGIHYERGHSSIKIFTDLISAYLIEAHGQGRNVVLMIDEAQNLPPEVLEQLRLLTNLETSERKLLQIILLGQPELKELLARTDLRQLSQRITARFHLKPLSQDECIEYIRHRLAVAGCNRPVFSKKAIDLIFHAAHGTPRLINLLCDRALLGTYSCNEAAVSPKHVQQASREVLGDDIEPRKSRVFIPFVLAFMLASMGSLLWLNGWSWWVDLADPAYVGLAQPSFEQSKLERVESKRSDLKRSDLKWPEPKSPDLPLHTVAALNKTASITNQNEPDQAATANTLKDTAAAISPDFPVQSPWAVIEKSGTKLLAFTTLADIWQLNLRFDHAKPCEQLAKEKLFCMQKRANIWLLREYNRPALFQISGADGQAHYAVIRAIQGGEFVIQLDRQRWHVTQSELEQHWQDKFTLLWRKPAGYKQYIKAGDTGQIITWLAQQMDVIQGEMIPPQAFTSMNAVLVERIKYFQQSEGLPSDGIAGPLTFVRVNEYIDKGKPRLTDKLQPLTQQKIQEKAAQVSSPLHDSAALINGDSAPVMAEKFAQQPWQMIEKTGTRLLALTTLADSWGVSLVGGDMRACEQLAEKKLFCLQQRANVWLLREYNRPAMFQIRAADGQRHYAVIGAIQDDKFVIQLGQQRWYVSQLELEQHWQGEMTLLWVKPADYEKDIQLGDSGRIVSWLAQKVNTIQGKANTHQAFTSMNNAFFERMKRFQKSEGLPADGIVGRLTLMRINEYFNQDIPYLSPAKAEARVEIRARAVAKAEAEAKAVAKAEARAVAKAKAKAEAEARAVAKVKAEAEAKAVAKAKAEARAVAKAKAEVAAKAKAGPELGHYGLEVVEHLYLDDMESKYAE